MSNTACGEAKLFTNECFCVCVTFTLVRAIAVLVMEYLITHVPFCLAGSANMGNKQVIPGDLGVNQSPVIAEIQAMYCEGDKDKAHNLVKSICEENLPQQEKVS